MDKNNNNHPNSNSAGIGNQLQTFEFNPLTGEVICKSINLDQYEENFLNNLIEAAEEIRDFPDCFMFYKVDESEYYK